MTKPHSLPAVIKPLLCSKDELLELAKFADHKTASQTMKILSQQGLL